MGAADPSGMKHEVKTFVESGDIAAAKAFVGENITNSRQGDYFYGQPGNMPRLTDFYGARFSAGIKGRF